jgi:hypothetical protein
VPGNIDRPGSIDTREPEVSRGAVKMEPLWGPDQVSEYLGVPIPTLYQSGLPKIVGRFELDP